MKYIQYTHTLTHMHTPKHTHTYIHTYILWVLVWGREELPTTLKLTNKFIAILYEYYIYIHTYYTYIYIYKYFRLFQRILQPRNPSNNKWVDDWYKQTTTNVSLTHFGANSPRTISRASTCGKIAENRAGGLLTGSSAGNRCKDRQSGKTSGQF